MIAVLARLQWMTLRGKVLRSLRLLRQPKYLVGFIVGFGWMAFWVLRPLLRSRVSLHGIPLAESDEAIMTTIHMAVALFVSLAMPLPWLLPWGQLGLPFREAELTMLLQAPLTRRQVIQYGLLKSEIGVLITALVTSMIVVQGDPLTRLCGFLGTWVLFEFWHLNGKWRALNNLRQTEVPVATARRRRLLLTAGVLAYYAALFMILVPFAVSLGSQFNLEHGRGLDVLPKDVSWPPVLVVLLTPAKILTAAIFTSSPLRFLLAIVPGLLLVVAQREIVLRSKARFEEGALEQASARESKKSPTRRFARRSVRSRSRYPFKLSRHGPQELALIWKNCLRVSRVPWTRITLGGCAVLLVVGALPAVLRFHDLTYGFLAAIGATMMLGPPLLAGMTWNNDLRTELAHLELVRLWPVPAGRFMLAQVLSPALLSFAMALFGSALVLIGLFGSRLRQALTGTPPQLDLIPDGPAFLGVHPALALVLLVVSTLPLVAAVSFLSSALQNLATVFVPAWSVTTADRTQGIAAFGRRMVFSWAMMFALLLAMIPSAILVGGAALIQRSLGISWSAWAFPLWGVLAAAPVFFGGWSMVHVAARLWERFDPSREMLEIGR